MNGKDTAKLIDAEFQCGLRPDRRRTLLERLRGDADARRRWDHSAELFRALERAEVSTVELEQVERWLFEDLEPDPATEPGRLRRLLARWRWPTLGGLILATAAVALMILPRERADELERTDGWAARGQAFGRPLGLDAACGLPPRSAADHGCELGDRLGFAYRWPAPAADGGTLARGYLSLFGVGHDGELLYYAPTPVDPAVAVERRSTREAPWDAWRSLGFTVNLAVNHEPGTIRVYALLSARAPTVSTIEALAHALAEQEPALPGASAWHRRLELAELDELCADRRRCASAELSYAIESTNN